MVLISFGYFSRISFTIWSPNALVVSTRVPCGSFTVTLRRALSCVGKNSVGMTSSNERLARKIMEAKPTTVFRWLTHQRSTLA